MKTFEKNELYTCKSICDNTMTWMFSVYKRTKCTVTVLCACNDFDGLKTFRIQHDKDGNEYILPLGKDYLAPILRAENVLSI